MANVATLAVGSLGVVLALLFGGVSLGTDHWINYTVNRGEELAAATDNDTYYFDPLYFSRNRGMLRTCYEGTDTLFLESEEYADDVVDGRCFTEGGYELTQIADRVTWGENYELRIHLMRSHFAFHCLSLVLYLTAIWCVMCGCWSTNYQNLRLGAFMGFFGGIVMAGGAGFFHGVDYLEREKIDQEIFRKVWANSPHVLSSYSGYSFGYSYICAWISCGLALISCIVLMCASDTMALKSEEAELPKKKLRHHNKAYDYMGDDMSQMTGYPAPYPVPYPMTYDYPTMGGPMMLTYPDAGNAIPMPMDMDNVVMGPPLPEVASEYPYPA